MLHDVLLFFAILAAGAVFNIACGLAAAFVFYLPRRAARRLWRQRPEIKAEITRRVRAAGVDQFNPAAIQRIANEVVAEFANRTKKKAA